MNPLQLLAALFTLPSQVQTKANILAICVAAGLNATSFTLGEPTERWIEVMSRAMDAYEAVPQQAIRGMFLDLATDPGDVDVFGNPDLSADQTPRPGFLSALGLSWYGIQRNEATYATLNVTVTNNTSAPITFAPYQLTFESSDAQPDGGFPTYRNAPGSVYTGINGTLTLAIGASATIPLIADQIGSYGNAIAGHVSTLVTQTYGALTVSNSTAATGLDRESAPAYRLRCRLAVSVLALGGPAAKYLYAMSTAYGGGPLQKWDGSGPVSIQPALSYVSLDSSTGEVTIYYAGPSGAVSSVEVSAANANIAGTPSGAIVNPIGVWGDCATVGPTVSDPNTGGPGGASATNLLVPVNFAVKAKASALANIGGATPGTYGVPWAGATLYAQGQKVQNGANLYVVAPGGDGTSAGSGGPTGTGTGIVDGGVTWNWVSAASTNTTGTLAVFHAIASALGVYLPSTTTGGLDQTAGSGFVYTGDLQDEVASAAAGLYAASVSVPATDSTAVSLGYIAVAGTITGVLTVVAG